MSTARFIPAPPTSAHPAHSHDHEHSHEHSHDHAAQEHGHTHEIMEHPGMILSHVFVLELACENWGEELI